LIYWQLRALPLSHLLIWLHLLPMDHVAGRKAVANRFDGFIEVLLTVMLLHDAQGLHVRILINLV
jgi:hypothetical protein